MSIDLKHTAAILLVIIGLIALNVYQWQNPRVVEVPGGTQQIDSTAWVQRSAYLDRGSIIDSLKKQNKALANEILEYGDAIASYARLTGKLRLKVDSLETHKEEWQDIPKNSFISEKDTLRDANTAFLRKARLDLLDMKTLADTTFISQRQFGGGLFLVTGTVEFKQRQFRQRLYLEQLRDIRLDVVSTVSRDQSRVLTFVSSPDFESLEYKSFTELKPQRKRLPWFWIGLATGVAGAAVIIN
ncbi:hypothetical protein [Gracilimonas tropica]|uniref:hypothetical protein n=1 Tax=Gracilimonas tropica TaxID=454600 RepID=UPI00058CCF3D|nr:hypothetical protein [Gracilimonas tropica]